MKRFNLLLGMLLCGVLFVACSDGDDDDSGYVSLLSGRLLGIYDAELYNKETKVDEYEAFTVKLRENGKVDVYGADHGKDWIIECLKDIRENATWKCTGNDIVIKSSIEGVGKVKTIALKIVNVDRKTGDFVLRYNVEDSKNKDYILFKGFIDSDEYD